MDRYFKVQYNKGGHQGPCVLIVKICDRDANPVKIAKTCRLAVEAEEGVVSAANIFNIDKVEW